MRQPERQAVIVVCDSLRRDLIRPDLTPTLSRLGPAAASFPEALSVYPSTTRVAAATIATGCRPGRHGLIGNTMVLDEPEGLACRSVGEPSFRSLLRRVTGRTLRVPTMAERLAAHGGAVVFSNVSPGAAYFHDPDGHGHVYHPAGSYAPGLARIPDPDGLAVAKGAEGDRAMTERFCREVLRERRPALAVLWLSEPDHTGHHRPLGSPDHLAAIAAADACVAMVLDTVAALDPAGSRILTVVCSDHGMETVRRAVDLDALLVAAGLKDAPDSREVVVAPNGTAALIHLAPAVRGRAGAIRRFLSAADWVGAVFGPEALAGIGLVHEGSVALALTTRQDDDANAFGIPGTADLVREPGGGDYVGCGQHGGLGANEQRPFLYLAGPGITAGPRRGAVSPMDIAPTVLRHLGHGTEGIDGRALA